MASTETDVVIRGTVVVVLAICLLMSWIWWRKHAEDREAMRGAMPGCIARLGSEADCDARFDEHHRVCFNYNNKPAGKLGPRVFDDKGYLECILQGPEPWAAAGRAARARRQSAEPGSLR